MEASEEEDELDGDALASSSTSSSGPLILMTGNVLPVKLSEGCKRAREELASLLK